MYIVHLEHTKDIFNAHGTFEAKKKTQPIKCEKLLSVLVYLSLF